MASKSKFPKSMVIDQDLMSRTWKAARPIRKVVIEKAIKMLRDSPMRAQGVG